jgi:DMSO/TMAO reductase YedYZ heme-binding membrane subunit
MGARSGGLIQEGVCQTRGGRGHLVDRGRGQVDLPDHRAASSIARRWLSSHAVYILDLIAYAFIIAMTITSFDRVSKRMQYATWKRLHLTGSYVIWLAFFIAYWRRGVTYTEFYAPFLMIVVAALITDSSQKRSETAIDAM